MRHITWMLAWMILSGCQFAFSHEFRTYDDTMVPPETAVPVPTIARAMITRTPWPTQAARATAVHDQTTAITAIEAHTIQLYDQSAPAVVAIEALFRHPPVEGMDVPTDMFVSQGSGFVYDDQGHIVTNAHVVSTANAYQIRIDEQRVVSATVIGRDNAHDLAVLQLDDFVEIAPLALSQRPVRAGMWVMAIGNPFGLRDSVSVGIVSGTNREVPNDFGVMRDIIQIDASVNPGSSGGVLLDSNGAVLGLVTAIQSGNGNFSGIGYAIPVATIQTVIPRLIAGH